MKTIEIDGVFSGGGIKGFALIGAYQSIEARGFTFKRLVGTSAGSIIASLIMAGYTSGELKKIIQEIDFKKMLDERKAFIPFPITKWILLYWRLGLYKGDMLELWMTEMLAKKGVYTFNDLPRGSLRFIASDLTNARIMILPDDLPNYGMQINTFPIAKAVRMSCSLPYFFEPVKLKTTTGKSIIVDGGVLSNFPIWIYSEENKLKQRPVIGVKLSAINKNIVLNKITNPINLLEALFETMRVAHDTRYISRKYEKDIIFIPIEANISTDFTLSLEEKDELITLGYEIAEKFLKKWSY